MHGIPLATKGYISRGKFETFIERLSIDVVVEDPDILINTEAVTIDIEVMDNEINIDTIEPIVEVDTLIEDINIEVE